MISVLILTLNEEVNLRRCIESVSWSDDIVVLDSGSTDRTVEIAREMGARVVVRPFDNERDHRTFSLRQITFKYAWVYNPDADEFATPELGEEMRKIAADPKTDCVAYMVRRKNMFMGRWLRHGGMTSTTIMRFFKPESITFRRCINPEYLCNGQVGCLRSYLLHYSFNKGLNAWVEKHNRYSWDEARETLADLRGGHMNWKGLFTFSDGVIHRRALKQLSFRLPCRSVLRFVYMYLFKLGILDGRAGLTYCLLVSFYEYLITVKVWEIRRRERNLPI